MNFDLPPINRGCPDEELLTDVRYVAAILNKRAVTIVEYNARGRFHSSTLIRRFKSWTRTLKLAGLEPENFNYGISIDDALADLRDVASRLGVQTLTLTEFRAHGKWSPRPLIRHFGSWLKALRAAGLNQTRANRRITDEELYENLERMWQALGRPPRYGEVSNPFSKFSAGTYANRFGSWRNALESFASSVSATLKLDSPQAATEPEVSPLLPVRRVTSRPISWRLRYLVLRRDNFRCRLCGATPAQRPGVTLHVDHIEPWSKGGDSVIDNLQTCCEECNIGKSDLPLGKES